MRQPARSTLLGLKASTLPRFGLRPRCDRQGRIIDCWGKLQHARLLKGAQDSSSLHDLRPRPAQPVAGGSAWRSRAKAPAGWQRTWISTSSARGVRLTDDTGLFAASQEEKPRLARSVDHR